MTTWTLTAHELPLRYLWKISRNASATKTNLVLQATQGGTSGQYREDTGQGRQPCGQPGKTRKLHELLMGGRPIRV